MDGQRQHYVPLPPPPSMQNSQSHILTSLPPPPPRHPPTQTQGVVLPPPPGPPPNAATYAKIHQQHGGMAWQQAWARQPVPQTFPPPPPPLIPANQTQNQHLAYNRQPAALSIPPLPPPGEGQPLTSATYIPMPGSFGPGVGIPALADSYSSSTYDSHGQTAANQPYEHVNADMPSYTRDAHAPATPLGRNGPSSLGLPENVLSPGQSNSANRTTDLSKSPSHRHNNSSASLGGLSPNEASTQWPLERVLLWLAKNGFSKDWQETFNALELQGADFIELGYGSNGFGNFGKMHKVVYPQLAKECEKSGTGWDSSREREEGKRMRRLIRQIHDQGHHDTGSLTPRRQEPPHSALDSSPRFEPVSAAHSAVESSPGFKASYNRQNAQMRSVTMPNPSIHDTPALDPNPSETTAWVPADHHRNLLSATNDHHRRQRSNDSDNLPLSARPHEDSPKSGSPPTQHATLAHHGLSSSSTSDLSVKFEHSRGNSSDSTRGRYYERKQDQEGARPSTQDPHNRHWNSGETLHKEHNKLRKLFRKKVKPNDSSHPSPEELHLESPTSPVHPRGTYTPYGQPIFSRSDVSLGGRPLSGSQSDYERLPVRAKPVQKGKKFVFVTMDGLNYRLVDITDIDSVGTLRSTICQNLGISDWTGAQVFLTEPGQTEHDDPLDDSLLTVNQRTKSDPFGSLKFFVRGTHVHPGGNNAAHFTGLGVSFPEKAAASPTTGPHHVHRKPLDEEALSRISPHHQPAQQTRSPVSKFPARCISQPFIGVSPAVDGSTDSTGTRVDLEKAALLARHEEHNREIERKQKANNITRGPPLTQPRKDAVYGETGYRREGVIDFDSPRISPYEDKKAEHLVPHRKPPTAPNESNTLTKVNSLRKKDADRPRIEQAPQSQSHGLGAALASMGRLTSAIGTPSTNPAENKAPKGTPVELTAPPATWNETPVTEKSPVTATSPVPKPGLQSRKSYGPEFDFEEANVSFQRTPDLQEDDSDDDSDDGLFAVPIANQSQDTGKASATASPEAQKAPRPSLTLDTEPRIVKGRSVTFKTPSTSGEIFVNGGGDNGDLPAPFGMAESPEDERPPRRDSFARGDIWASRPPVEGVIDNLDDFFPNVDLDAPYLEGQGGSPPTSPASKNPAEVDSHRTLRQDGFAPASQFNHDGEPTMKAQDQGVVARRNVTRSGGLTRMKSIREVAKGANQTSKSRSVAHSGPQKSGDILRRKSTKMFGAKIMQISPRPGRRLNQLDPIPQNKPIQEPVPQRQPTFRIIRGQLIGKGTFGRVYLGMNADNGEVLAVKQVDINPRLAGQDRDRVKDMVSALNQEIDTMQHLEHPNIVQYLGCERGEFSISIYLEYISGGSVGSCLRKHGKFEESVVKSLTRQTLDGLAYLHHQGILHRDLKADNILLDLDGSCRISDFGISKKTDDIYGNDSTNSMQGSVFWMAPEVIQSQGQGYSAKVDIWSLGCVVLEMFAGRRPWSREEAIGAIFKLGSLNQAPPIPEDVSMNITPAALAFMYDCFTVDSSDRPTADTLLTHPFCAPDPKYNFLDTELHAKIRHVL